MQIIASNAKGKGGFFNKRQKFWPISLVASILTLVLLVFFGSDTPFFNYLMPLVLCFVALALIFSVTTWMKNLKSPFCAYTDGGNLFINYVSENAPAFRSYGNNSIYHAPAYGEALRKLSCPFNQIIGYKLHVFFKQPSVLELQLKEAPGMILNVVVPIDSLNGKEIRKLVDFIEQIIPHHTINPERRLKG